VCRCRRSRHPSQSAPTCAPRVDSTLGIAIAHVSSGGIGRLERASQAPAERPACAHDAAGVVSASTGLAAQRGLCRVRNPRPVGAADRDDATRPSPTTDLFRSLLTSHGAEVLAVFAGGGRGLAGERQCPRANVAAVGPVRRRPPRDPARRADRTSPAVTVHPCKIEPDHGVGANRPGRHEVGTTAPLWWFACRRQPPARTSAGRVPVRRSDAKRTLEPNTTSRHPRVVLTR
jgi:hypothetical protein